MKYVAVRSRWSFLEIWKIILKGIYIQMIWYFIQFYWNYVSIVNTAFRFIADMEVRGVSQVYRHMITTWISTWWRRTISKSFYMKLKSTMDISMLLREVSSNWTETSFQSEWLSMCSKREWLGWSGFRRNNIDGVIMRTLTFAYDCIICNLMK